jgi:ligand-binding sensor domain-containing protein
MTIINLRLFILYIVSIGASLPLLSNAVFAQYATVKFSSLDINNGLSQNNVKCILKDHEGYMWFGTDDGLNRYNGYNFTVYRHNSKDNSSLPANNISALFEDRAENLWVGTGSGGLSVYNRGTDAFTTYHSKKNDESTLSSDEINSVVQDREGNIWVGTYAGLNLFNKKTKTFKRFFYTKNREDADNGHVFAIAEDNGGILWLGTGAGLIEFNYRTGYTRLYRHTALNSIGNNTVNTLLKNEDGNLYIGTAGGGFDIFDIKRQRFTHFTHQPGQAASLANNMVFSLCAAGSKKIWVGTEEGLDLFDEATATFTHYTDEGKDGQNENNSINYLFNRDGILWVGIYEAGLQFYDKNLTSFPHFFR